MTSIANPFNLTRAADLDDKQIVALWVDPQGELSTRLRLSSELPMIILGGKGSGKTHLMRYFSYEVQGLSQKTGSDPVAQSGYLGIYVRCSGLNADRFGRKNFTPLQWHALFAFYIELWLGQSILQTAQTYIARSGHGATFSESTLVNDLRNLFDRPPAVSASTLTAYAEQLQDVQRALDLAINNASFRPVTMPEITVSPGRLIFGLPQALARHVPALRSIKFTLLIDEYENLPENAQQYVNTLLRERQNPVSFKIGARLYGMRTYRTFSGEEELREGSEYELLNLDATLRQKENTYGEFAMNLCLSRIRFAHGGVWPTGWTDENASERFEAAFERSATAEERARVKLAEEQRNAPGSMPCASI